MAADDRIFNHCGDNVHNDHNMQMHISLRQRHNSLTPRRQVKITSICFIGALAVVTTCVVGAESPATITTTADANATTTTTTPATPTVATATTPALISRNDDLNCDNINAELPKPLLGSRKQLFDATDDADDSPPTPAVTRQKRTQQQQQQHTMRPTLMDVALQVSAREGLDAMTELYGKIVPDIIRNGQLLEQNHPATLLSKFSESVGETLEQEMAAYATISATKAFRKNYKYFNELARQAHTPRISLRRTALEGLCPPRDPPTCMPASERYRTHDGTCNNKRRPRWGAAQMPFNRFLPPEYGDGVDSIRTSVEGGTLASSRFVSLLVHGAKDGEAQVTLMTAQWGQLLDHDMTSTAQPRSINGSVPSCCGGKDFHPSCFPIKVPLDDPWLAPLKVRCLEFLRSAPAQRRDCILSWREQTNQATSYIDASPIYSNSPKSSDNARVFRNGLLVFGRGNPAEDVCQRGAIATQCIRAGDGRSGEQPGLLALHHVWVGEHNRVAAELSELNLHWSDEKLYQETRRILGAMFQHITYREFLPIILGREVCRLFDLELLNTGYYQGYDPKINPTVANSFAAAAFRFGHSLVQNSYMRCDRHHNVLSNNVSLHEEFQRGDIGSAGSLHRLIRGMAKQRALKRDEFITPELTNHLFQTPGFPFGLDLAAINIQRGRDHGVSAYTSWRIPCGLSAINNWEDLENVVGPESAQRIRHAYRSVHDIDLFVGGIAERPVVGGLVGPTFACIIAQQFSNSRRGDRFWYENGDFESAFTPAQLHSLRRVSLAQVLCRAVGGGTFQPHIFIPANFAGNERQLCGTGALAPIDLRPWQEQDPFGTPTTPTFEPENIFEIISSDKDTDASVQIIKENKAGFANRVGGAGAVNNAQRPLTHTPHIEFIPNASSGFQRPTANIQIHDKLDIRQKLTATKRPLGTSKPITGVNNKLDKSPSKITLNIRGVTLHRTKVTRRPSIVVNNIPIELRTAGPDNTTNKSKNKSENEIIDPVEGRTENNENENVTEIPNNETKDENETIEQLEGRTEDNDTEFKNNANENDTTIVNTNVDTIEGRTEDTTETPRLENEPIIINVTNNEINSTDQDVIEARTEDNENDLIQTNNGTDNDTKTKNHVEYNNTVAKPIVFETKDGNLNITMNKLVERTNENETQLQNVTQETQNGNLTIHKVENRTENAKDDIIRITVDVQNNFTNNATVLEQSSDKAKTDLKNVTFSTNNSTLTELPTIEDVIKTNNNITIRPNEVENHKNLTDTTDNCTVTQNATNHTGLPDTSLTSTETDKSTSNYTTDAPLPKNTNETNVLPQLTASQDATELDFSITDIDPLTHATAPELRRVQRRKLDAVNDRKTTTNRATTKTTKQNSRTKSLTTKPTKPANLKKLIGNTTSIPLISTSTTKPAERQAELRQYQTQPTYYTRPQKVVVSGPNADQYEIEINIRQTNKNPSSTRPHTTSSFTDYTPTTYKQHYGFDRYSPHYVGGDYYTSTVTPPPHAYYQPAPTISSTVIQTRRTKPPTVIYLNEHEDRLTTRAPGLFQSFITFATSGFGNTNRPRQPSPHSTAQKEQPLPLHSTSGVTNLHINSPLNTHTDPSSLSHYVPRPVSQNILSPQLAPASLSLSQVGGVVSGGVVHASSGAISAGNYGAITGVANTNGADSTFSFNIRPKPNIVNQASVSLAPRPIESGSYGLLPSRKPAYGGITGPEYVNLPIAPSIGSNKPGYYENAQGESQNSPFSSEHKRPAAPLGNYGYYKRTQSLSLQKKSATAGDILDTPDYDEQTISRTLQPIVSDSEKHADSKEDDDYYADEDEDEYIGVVKKFDRDGYLRPEHMIDELIRTKDNPTKNDTDDKNCTKYLDDNYVLPVLNTTLNSLKKMQEPPKPIRRTTEAPINTLIDNVTNYPDIVEKHFSNNILAEDYNDEMTEPTELTAEKTTALTELRSRIMDGPENAEMTEAKVKKQGALLAFAPIKVLTKLERPDHWVIFDMPSETPLLPEQPQINVDSSAPTDEIPMPIQGVGNIWLTKSKTKQEVFQKVIAQLTTEMATTNVETATTARPPVAAIVI